MLNHQRRLTLPRPHCGSHCHQLRILLTLHFLWRQAAQRAVECARHAEPASEQTERIEIRALLTLIGTWTLDKAGIDAAFERCAHAHARPPDIPQRGSAQRARAWLRLAGSVSD